jgi:hypothetical protein
MGNFKAVFFIRRFDDLFVTAFYEVSEKKSMIIGWYGCPGILFCQVFLAVGDHRH